MKKLCSIIFTVLIVFSISSCSLFGEDNSKTKWFDSKSDNKINTVEVTKVGGTFTFGDQELLITANGSELFSTELSNDGGELDDDNYSISWVDNNIVVIIFKGEEQKDEKFTITFSGSRTKYIKTVEK